MEIKLADEKNLIEVSYIIRKCAQQFIESGHRCWEFAPSDFADIANDISKKQVYLASLKKIPVGTISLRPDSADAGVTNIDRLAVFPHYQRRGYAKILIDFAIDQASKKGSRVVRGVIPSNNQLLIKMLEDRGFVNMDITVKMYNEENGSVFEKLLT